MVDLGGMSSLYTGFLETQNTAGAKLKEEGGGAGYLKAPDEGLLGVCKKI